MGKTHSDMVINDMRYILDLHEDKSMHYNRFVHKEPPSMVVEDYDNLVEIPLKQYFEIEGNIDFLSVEPFDDPELTEKVKIIEGINYKETKKLLNKFDNHTDEYQLKYIENDVWFAVNVKDKYTFSIFK
jgi:hypothetical protein